MPDYSIRLPAWTIGIHALEQIPSVCRESGTRAVLIGGRRAMAAIADKIEAASGPGIEIVSRLSWPATGAESYTVEYGYQGMSQGDGTSVTVNTNTCVLTGLDRNTHYDAYVRGNCSGAAGVWSAVVSFTTTSGGQGILDADGDQAVVVYPNPASEMVTITAPAASTVTLVDLNGRQSGSWYTEDGSLTIDVSDLAKGAYFVRVTTAEGTAVRKLIVK